MADNLSKAQRSYCMSRIKSKNTSQEIKLRKCLWGLGFRYRIKNNLAGRPDIVFSSKKVVVFIDGCFWHMCPKCFKAPKSNKRYWLPKLRKNAERDRKNEALLRRGGWTIIRVWEHDLKKNFNKVLKTISAKLRKAKASS